jgi:hypothetical protein
MAEAALAAAVPPKASAVASEYFIRPFMGYSRKLRG